MPLGLGELANLLRKSQRLPEIPEAETALEASRLIEQMTKSASFEEFLTLPAYELLA